MKKIYFICFAIFMLFVSCASAPVKNVKDVQYQENNQKDSQKDSQKDEQYQKDYEKVKEMKEIFPDADIKIAMFNRGTEVAMFDRVDPFIMLTAKSFINTEKVDIYKSIDDKLYFVVVKYTNLKTAEHFSNKHNDDEGIYYFSIDKYSGFYIFERCLVLEKHPKISEKTVSSYKDIDVIKNFFDNNTQLFMKYYKE